MGLHQSERRWVLDYITAIGVSLPYLKTRERYPSLYSIGAIEDLETFDYYPLRGNFVPTSATCSASPSLSGTHCGREHLCSAEGKKEVCQPSEAATGVFSRLPGVHRTHQCRRSRHRRVHSCCRSWTNARKDSGAIAAGASTSTDFPNGQSGTGRLSFRLRRLLRNAKHPDCQCSLRYYMKFRCRGCSLKQSTGLFLYRSRGVETRSLLRKNCRELRHSYAALRDGCVLIRQLAQLLDCVLRWQYRREPSCTRRC